MIKPLNLLLLLLLNHGLFTIPSTPRIFVVMYPFIQGMECIAEPVPQPEGRGRKWGDCYKLGIESYSFLKRATFPPFLHLNVGLHLGFIGLDFTT